MSPSLDGNHAARSEEASLVDRLFIGTAAGNEAYEDAMEAAVGAVVDTVGDAEGPYTGRTFDDLRSRLDSEILPESGAPLEEVINCVAADIIGNSVYPTDERCVAHLQCPPMVPALAAEALLTAINQSMDSFDQAPAATVVERRLIDDLARLFDLGPDADGVVTTGGTQSNYQGLLLARDHYVSEQLDHSVRERGLPPKAADMRVLCSDQAHFTATQATAELGLGEDAVVTVPTDDDYRMDPDALRTTLDRLEGEGERPFALFGTAGTTDFGSVDPLDDLADVAKEFDLWYHIDAAYGGAVAVSDSHQNLLAGIERADSLAVDFHKLFYQPLSCGAFLLRDGTHFELLSRNASYLNPEGDDTPHQVEKSTMTSRRFDALKPYVAFRTLGREGMATLVERTLSLADEAAAMIRDADTYELDCEPTLNVVTLRYVPQTSHPDVDAGPWADRVNEAVRRELFKRGDTIVARTTVDSRTHLKLTLLHPRTTIGDVSAFLEAGKEAADAFETDALAGTRCSGANAADEEVDR